MNIRTLSQQWLPLLAPEDFFILLAHTIGKEKPFLLAHPEYELSEANETLFRQYLHRRQKHEPVAYITEHKEFYGRDFSVTPATLIPRPETEHLIESALNAIFNFQFSIFKNIDIIDVGTGSGNIIVTLAAELMASSQDIHFFGTDVSPAALAIARHNADTHHVLKNILFIESDLLQNFSFEHKDKRHFIITANLPYLSETIYQESDPDVRCFEPHSALVSGTDGLDHYRRLLRELAEKSHHIQSLFILFEISPEQSVTVQQEILRLFPASTIEIIPDLSGRSRLVQASLL